MIMCYVILFFQIPATVSGRSGSEFT